MSIPIQAREIQARFARVAPRYDFLNHFLSAGMDFGWRRILVREVKKQNPSRILDLATGSGDVLRALIAGGLGKERAIGADFCLPMLHVASKKGLEALVVGDALRLPFESASFDAVTMAFGFRNVVDRRAALREVGRVLRPGGGFYLLEFSHPVAFWKEAYWWYLKNILPSVAQGFGAPAEDYDYLAESIRHFPDQTSLELMIRAEGFERVEYLNLTGGISALHVGYRAS